jgi:hypothetical protein
MDEKTDFEKISQEKEAGFFADFGQFLQQNKKWWLLPILLVLLIVAALMFFGSGAAAPCIYTMF